MRQWPGNVRDLSFRSVIEECISVVVSLAPVPGAVSDGFLWNAGFGGTVGQAALDAYQASDEYAAASKILPFARLWCCVEISAALGFGKPLVLQCVAFERKADDLTMVRLVGGSGSVQMLQVGADDSALQWRRNRAAAPADIHHSPLTSPHARSHI